MQEEMLLQLTELLLQIMEACELYKGDRQNLSKQQNSCIDFWNVLSRQVDNLDMPEQKHLLDKAFQLAKNYETPQKIDAAFLLQMSLHHKSATPSCTCHVLKRTYEASNISEDAKYFLYWQLQIQIFPKSDFLMDEKNRILLFKIYHKLYKDLEKNYFPNATPQEDRTEIPVENRDSDLILVTVAQLSDISHGPTKTTLDRCYILIKKYHKKILLIETAEFGSLVNGIPLLEYKIADHHYQSIITNTLRYQDAEIPFIQWNIAWTMRERCDALIQVVREKKPLFILNIGGNSLATDLCHRLIPTYTISTIPSGLIPTAGTFQMTGHRLTEQEIHFLDLFGKKHSHVIEGTFTSTIFTIKHHRTREELGLPPDKFLAFMVGFRLGDEVTREFMELLLACTKKKVHYIFIGRMNNFDLLGKTISGFKDNCTYLGFIEDVLSVVELCDLYINPRRMGGGTSCVEAMSVGIPVLSYNVGDVSVNAGEDFCVDTPDAYCATLERYLTDATFYAVQSKKAEKRAKFLLDSSKNFSSVLEEFYRRANIPEEYWHSRKRSPQESSAPLFSGQMPCYFDKQKDSHSRQEKSSEIPKYYVWDSCGHLHANQWKKVKNAFMKESCYDENLIYYTVQCIWYDLMEQIGLLCAGRCRNAHLAPMNISMDNILGQLETIFSDREFIEMALVMGEQGIADLLEQTSHIRFLPTDANAMKSLHQSWLTGFLYIAMENEASTPAEKLKAITEFILQKKNTLCLGLSLFIDLTGQCDDAALATESQHIQQVIKKYDQCMSHLDNSWLAKILA